MTGAKVTIDSMSVDTGNPGRDESLMKAFFGLFAGEGAIEASIESLFGDNEKGTLSLSVTMNGVTKKVPMSYALVEGVFKAEGYVDLFDFALGGALTSLTKQCATMHRDKTWNDVMIKLIVPVARK